MSQFEVEQKAWQANGPPMDIDGSPPSSTGKAGQSITSVCQPIDASNGHSEGQKSLQKAYHQQPTSLSTLSEPGAGFSD